MGADGQPLGIVLLPARNAVDADPSAGGMWRTPMAAFGEYWWSVLPTTNSCQRCRAH